MARYSNTSARARRSSVGLIEFVDAWKIAEANYRSPGRFYQILFHDAVYETGEDAGLNEERSADLAVTVVESEVSSELVRRLIMVTKHTPEFAPQSLDEETICDIDLASLGASPDRFAKHCADIRKSTRVIPMTLLRALRTGGTAQSSSRDRSPESS